MGKIVMLESTLKVAQQPREVLLSRIKCPFHFDSHLYLYAIGVSAG